LTGKEGKMMGFAETLHEERNGFLLSDDPALIDADRVHVWISEESYWANGRSKELMNRALEGSHVIGVYRDGEQVAICRIVSDGATFAWLCDIFVDASVRGKGIGTWISQSAVPKGSSEWCLRQGMRTTSTPAQVSHHWREQQDGWRSTRVPSALPSWVLCQQWKTRPKYRSLYAGRQLLGRSRYSLSKESHWRSPGQAQRQSSMLQ
jgi:GNAT superfamily N-acetyltransferase